MTKKIKNERLTSRWSIKEPLYIDKKDKRYKKYAKQLKEDGFCNCETWGLSSVIAEFVLPRLKRYKEVTNGYPSNLTEEKWNEILDKMIFAFEWHMIEQDNPEEYSKLSPEKITLNWKRYEEGMKLFAEYFLDLWW